MRNFSDLSNRSVNFGEADTVLLVENIYMWKSRLKRKILESSSANKNLYLMMLGFNI